MTGIEILGVIVLLVCHFVVYCVKRLLPMFIIVAGSVLLATCTSMRYDRSSTTYYDQDGNVTAVNERVDGEYSTAFTDRKISRLKIIAPKGSVELGSSESVISEDGLRAIAEGAARGAR